VPSFGKDVESISSNPASLPTRSRLVRPSAASPPRCVARSSWVGSSVFTGGASGRHRPATSGVVRPRNRPFALDFSTRCHGEEPGTRETWKDAWKEAGTPMFWAPMSAARCSLGLFVIIPVPTRPTLLRGHRLATGSRAKEPCVAQRDHPARKVGITSSSLTVVGITIPVGADLIAITSGSAIKAVVAVQNSFCLCVSTASHRHTR